MPLPYDFFHRYGPWAVVTGASAGMGAEFARQLAEAGLFLVLVARREEKLQAFARELEMNYPVKTVVIAADLSTEAGWNAVISGTETLNIGLLVNNAGINLVGSFFRHSLEQHERLIALHVTGATALAHAFGRQFAAKGRGGILFMSSILARPYPWYSTYCATKAYLSTLSVVLSEELAPKGVTVLAVEPGWVETEMVERERLMLDYDKMGANPQPADECVREALEALYMRKVRFVPGFMTRVSEFFMGLLPESYRMKVLAASLDPALRADLKEI